MKKREGKKKKEKEKKKEKLSAQNLSARGGLQCGSPDACELGAVAVLGESSSRPRKNPRMRARVDDRPTREARGPT